MTETSRTVDCRQSSQLRRFEKSADSPETVLSRDRLDVSSWVSSLPVEHFTVLDDKSCDNIRDHLSQVPKLLHSISLLRLIRRINWIGSIILITYGYLYQLLTYNASKEHYYQYKLYDFLVDYGITNLIVAEAIVLAKTYFLMLRFHRAVLHLKAYSAKYRGLKTYLNLFHEFKHMQEDPAEKSVLVHSSDLGDTSLHLEMRKALRRSERCRSYYSKGKEEVRSKEDQRSKD